MKQINRLEHFLGHIAGGDEYLDDVDAIRTRVTELERERDEARAEAKKWEKRASWCSSMCVSCTIQCSHAMFKIDQCIVEQELSDSIRRAASGLPAADKET